MSLFYKIILDSMVIDAGFSFLRIDQRGKLLYCDVDDAQLLQGWRQDRLYRSDWLRPLEDAHGIDYTDAGAEMIDEAEFNELIEILGEGEEVPVPEPGVEPEPEPDTEPDAEPEHKMTVQEMRDEITRINETLDIIMGVTE